jgi:hypothetical protein
VRKLLLITIAGLVAYLAYRPRLLRWGATDEEMQRPMAGDDLIEHPIVVTNRAVTVEAPPEDVWPWIPQMGELPRGGFYSYEWIERLMGMRVRNADKILAEYQSPSPGHAIDHTGNMTVRAIEDGRVIVLGPPPGLWLDSTWSIAVYPTPDGHTRLVSRVRAHVNHWTPIAPIIMALLDPGQFIMERKFLLEIKKRAESLAHREALTIAAAAAQGGGEPIE